MKRKYEDFDFEDKEYIKSRIQKYSQPDENKIIEYIKNGNDYCMSPGIVYDVFDDEQDLSKKRHILGPYNYTDGEWDWSNVLVYYIENYHYRISDDFRAHMMSNNWKCPQLNKMQIKKICENDDCEFERQKQQRFVTILQDIIKLIQADFELKHYNLEFLAPCFYSTYNINDMTVKPHQDKRIKEVCLAYDTINDEFFAAKIYEHTQDDKKIKYAAYIKNADKNNVAVNYWYWKIISE